MFARGTRTCRMELDSFAKHTPSKWNVLFFGSDNVSAASLRALHAEQQRARGVVGRLEVVCPQDKPKGRGMRMSVGHLKVEALSMGLTVHSMPATSEGFKDWYVPFVCGSGGSMGFDLAVVVSFGYFVPPAVLAQLPWKGINMHPSLLPRYRGPAPIYHTLLNGDEETGVSIITLDPQRFDAGEVLYQERRAVPKGIMYRSLEELLAEQGAQALIKTLQTFDVYYEQRFKQNEEYACHAPKVKKSDGKLDFTANGGADLLRRFRALAENVGVYTEWNDKRILFHHMRGVLDGERLDQDMDKVPAGGFWLEKGRNGIMVKCADDQVLHVSKLQVAGRKAVDAQTFANGYHVQRHWTPEQVL